MAGGLLGTAVSGLLAFQRNLDTVGHNIANANTEGYSHQRVTLSTREAQLTGSGYLGQGVRDTEIKRVYDEFLNNQVISSKSAFTELDSFHTLSSQVDNFIADKGTSLSPALQSFFNGVQELANDPTSIPARQVLLTEGTTLADRFKTVNGRLNELRDQANSNITDITNEINSIAASIAELNTKITVATGLASGQPPNDLLDKRDVLLNQLAERIDVSTTTQEDGALNVFIGNGQPVVLSSTAATLGVQNSRFDPAQKDVTFIGQSNAVVITDNLSGGELGGTLRFLKDVLNPTQNEVGRIAVGLAEDFNTQHSAGFDLNGNTNLDFFSTPAATVFGALGNTGQITANISDVNALTASDYRLDLNAGNYTLTRLSDNTLTTLSPGFPGVSAIVDGITITETTTLANGDSFLIQPTRNSADQLTVNLSNGTQIAAASSNTSSGGVGDNTNALALVALENNQNLLNGTATFQDAFGQSVANVGAATQAAEVNKNAQEGLLNQAKEARESVSGVNLDEEAADLVKFQQAYQAAAQVIAVTNTLFDTLLGAFRR